jgi:hypothetical protein
VGPDQGDERRTIDELELRYRLEPELGDVFVEGVSDAAFIAWFLDQNQREGWRVYPIDTVDIPSERVRARELAVGERGEALTLGLELSERLQDFEGRGPLIVTDQDDDALGEGDGIGCDLCLLTDFTAMELYAFNTRTVDKFLRVFVRTNRIGADDLIALLGPALVEVFLLRAALRRVEKRIGIMNEITRCCSRSAEGIRVDITELARRSLNAPTEAPRPTVESVLEEVQKLRGRVPADARRAIHGHDLVTMLSWILDRYGVSPEFRRPEVIRRSLFLSLELEELNAYGLFSELLRRTAA